MCMFSHVALLFCFGLANTVSAQLKEEFVFAAENTPPTTPLAFAISGPGVARASYEAAPERCPRGLDDIRASIDGRLLLKNGYQSFFNAQRLPGDVAFAPGLCTTSFLSHENIKAKIAEAPQLLADGSAEKPNSLGIFRLNNVTFPSGVWSNDYRGISLAIPQEDHDIIRPLFDYFFGDGNPQGSMFANNGPRWNQENLFQSAEAFLAEKKELRIGIDTNIWVLKELHKIALGIDLPDEQAAQLASIQGAALILSLPPEAAVDEVADRIGIDSATVNFVKESFFQLYKGSILGNQGLLKKVGLENVDKVAYALLDVFVFAGGLSVSSAIRSSIGSFVTGLIDKGLTRRLARFPQKALPLLVLENIRLFPPVLSFPYVLENGQRVDALAGFAGYDQSVWGDDADDFRIRGRLNFYHKRTLNWADSALPVKDDPKTARICPGRSLSVVMAVQFLKALKLQRFCAHPDTPAIRGNGPSFWNTFTITTDCPRRRRRKHGSDVRSDSGN